MATPATVLFLNHRRDPLTTHVAALRSAGFDVLESGSLEETHNILASSTTAAPAVVVLNPLVLRENCVELELVEKLQQPKGPVPMILLVEHIQALEHARRVSVQFRDFVLKPYALPELVHRVELAVLTRAKFLALQQQTRDLQGLVTFDFKTGLLSERHFKAVLQVEFKRAQRHQLPLSLLMIDVDNFKTVNDSTEYAFADEVLREVAKHLREGVRETDYAARFGGDEFVLLLPHTTPAEAVHTAMRIRTTISAAVVANDRYKSQVTVSIGIDTFDGKSLRTPDELRRRANKALQEAKRRGKDQVWLYSEPNDSGEGLAVHGATLQ